MALRTFLHPVVLVLAAVPFASGCTSEHFLKKAVRDGYGLEPVRVFRTDLNVGTVLNKDDVLQMGPTVDGCTEPTVAGNLTTKAASSSVSELSAALQVSGVKLKPSLAAEFDDGFTFSASKVTTQVLPLAVFTGSVLPESYYSNATIQTLVDADAAFVVSQVVCAKKLTITFHKKSTLAAGITVAENLPAVGEGSFKWSDSGDGTLEYEGEIPICFAFSKEKIISSNVGDSSVRCPSDETLETGTGASEKCVRAYLSRAEQRIKPGYPQTEAGIQEVQMAKRGIDQSRISVRNAYMQYNAVAIPCACAGKNEKACPGLKDAKERLTQTLSNVLSGIKRGAFSGVEFR